MEGCWLYSRVGDEGWLQDFIFLFLMLINGTKEQDIFKIILLSCVTGEMERLVLDLTEAAKNREIWDSLEFVYGLQVILAKSKSVRGAFH